MFRDLFSTHPLAASHGALTWMSALACLLSLLWLLANGHVNFLGFLLALTILWAATAIDKRLGICLIFFYLFLLGDIRRFVGMMAGYPKLDPLLTVGPIVSLGLALPILMRLRLRDPLSKTVLALMTVMLLEIFNPRQGPITVGVAGAMFYVVPMLWYWIGREYGTERLLESIIYRVVVPVALLAAAVGMWQTYIGFLPWESAWLNEMGSGIHSMNLGGGFLRAFGFSVNGIEYIDLLLVASVSVLAAFFAGRRPYGVLFPPLVFALFLASSRSSIIKLLFAVSAAWALSSKGGRGWALRLPLALAIVFGILAFALAQFSSGASGTTQNSAASFSTKHQVEGLQHPFDNKRSTAGMHGTMFLSGFKTGLSYPIGYGLGAVTLGSSRLGGDETAAGSSEVDISDAFISMGIVGGSLYLYTIWLVLRRALTYGRTAPKYLGLPALAIIAAMGGAWIALGQYAIAPLVWFVIGSLARHGERSRQPSPRAAEPGPALPSVRLRAIPATALRSPP